MSFIHKLHVQVCYIRFVYLVLVILICALKYYVKSLCDVYLLFVTNKLIRKLTVLRFLYLTAPDRHVPGSLSS